MMLFGGAIYVIRGGNVDVRQRPSMGSPIQCTQQAVVQLLSCIYVVSALQKTECGSFLCLFLHTESVRGLTEGPGVLIVSFTELVPPAPLCVQILSLFSVILSPKYWSKELDPKKRWKCFKVRSQFCIRRLKLVDGPQKQLNTAVQQWTQACKEHDYSPELSLCSISL